MYLTKTNTFLIGWVAILLGYVMNFIFIGQNAIGNESIGLSIILFTIVIYMAMMPLTYRQQKFSRVSSMMNPELQAVQAKYKGRTNDPAVMQKMNEETQAVYAKYGVNPMGSCVQMVVQIVPLFALYRVIWNIPAYVDRVKNVFMPLAEKLMTASGAESYLGDLAKTLGVKFPEMNALTVIDVVYKFKPANWTDLASKFPDLKDVISSTQTQVDKMNYFMGMNIADSPMNIMRNAWNDKTMLLLIAAIMVPVLAAVTQWISVKLSMAMNPQMSSGNEQADSMTRSMSTMNNVMPLMSAFFCLTLPVGLGIYWIAGAVVRGVQTYFINKKLESVDFDAVLKKNEEKANKKRQKKSGLTTEQIMRNATMSTKNLESSHKDLQKKASQISVDTASTQNKKYKAGSLAAKANMVAEYNEKHKK